MLTAEENERLTRVGRGTPMGELVRRFWLPFLQVSDVAKPDGPPVRVTLRVSNWWPFARPPAA
jgi:phthalate 4,5-dioxygenase oxygenase subunit